METELGLLEEGPDKDIKESEITAKYKEIEVIELDKERLEGLNNTL